MISFDIEERYRILGAMITIQIRMVYLKSLLEKKQFTEFCGKIRGMSLDDLPVLHRKIQPEQRWKENFWE